MVRIKLKTNASRMFCLVLPLIFTSNEIPNLLLCLGSDLADNEIREMSRG